MPFYDVEAIEKFAVRTNYYHVEASSPEEAVQKCKSGDLGYDDKSFEDDPREWLETIEIELSDDQLPRY